MIVCMDPQHACTVFCTVHCCSVINSWRSAARRLAPGAPCSTRPSAGPALPPRAVRRRRAGPGTARDHTADRPRTAPGRARGDRSPRERPRCGYSKREALRLPARAACVTPRLALSFVLTLNFRIHVATFIVVRHSTVVTQKGSSPAVPWACCRRPPCARVPWPSSERATTGSATPRSCCCAS